ncbi:MULTISPECIES: SulP family inorganic anion transporter [Pseudomonas]|jgi:SulP family sulfate permease|uniref:SulP family inorganic anion transporter n=1 Tax=Pseudomonas lundensis TaxID=86185 RepID=A0ABX4GGK5_9PSED|nr:MULTISPECIES: SulP family inorganic anion transporter [Pseudomonas]MBM1183033.1 SulP family inorganic anion transporter [Pseudomonas lundensis]MCT8955016.1 SulP family inorganic anion transporter [Pseudomonas lundensis]NMZ56810.1 SulP family inorganic anion transporter [Pseudomonas lundensis]NNA26746.1 SulP family inorganic anion transporter [Pseudomonas lundensis]NNA36528.1 SulP family inorganic anion transporter [Pseudomonas lundensis]
MKFSRLRADVLAGLTTSFALLPECIAFALVAHLNPLMGLYGAFIICTLTALFGGRPGMVSGAAGSMAVVIIALVVQHGVQYFLATVLLGGLIMMAFGLLRLGKLVRMVPHPVMLGFVNGLAIIIAMAQLEHFKQDGQWLTGTPLYVMAGLVALTMLVVYGLPRLTKVAPPALVAILGVGLAVYLLGLPTRTLGDMAHIAGGLPSFSLPQIPWTFDTLRIIAPYAFLMAMVGLLETLLTLNLTDEITESRGYPDRECVALGAANMVSGAFGGMGGCAMIGQTVVNLSSGGRGRLSGVVAGVMIVLFVLFLSPLIERIPLAALVGVMFVVAQQTFAWASLRVLNKVPLNDVLVIVAVTVITVFTDLAFAVLCGIIIAALNFAWQQARQLYADSSLERDGSKLYRVHGTLFFASTTTFLNQFDPANDPAQVTLDCRHLSFVDYSAIAALMTLRERYAKAGKHLRVLNVSERCKKLLKRARVQAV